MSIQSSLAAFMLLSAPLMAIAAEGDLPYRTSGFYVGGSLGYSNQELNQDPIELSGGTFSWKALGGYRFPQGFLPWGIHVGLEAAWVSLGEIDENRLGSKLTLKTQGVEGYFVGMIPLTRKFELVGKAGAISWDADLEVDGVRQDDADGTDLALAIGIAYHTGDQVAAQFEIESFDLLDGAYLASVSVTYQFK